MEYVHPQVYAPNNLNLMKLKILKNNTLHLSVLLWNMFIESLFFPVVRVDFFITGLIHLDIVIEFSGIIVTSCKSNIFSKKFDFSSDFEVLNSEEKT